MTKEEIPSLFSQGAIDDLKAISKEEYNKVLTNTAAQAAGRNIAKFVLAKEVANHGEVS